MALFEGVIDIGSIFQLASFLKLLANSIGEILLVGEAKRLAVAQQLAVEGKSLGIHIKEQDNPVFSWIWVREKRLNILFRRKGTDEIEFNEV